ncbi:hypothetical protein TNCV_2691571 [Trichonephila clavipes]|uniref:Uncharacterized protein n=1 Tax=Trichonephila clavipes TaxID=2585209 RepID=A0A8X6VZ03_TRICX|nr:hypothetical protein TNCV_2691571 [Trichonephila clavipes]
MKTPSAENTISPIKLFDFLAKILIERVLPYTLEEWISKNTLAKYRLNIRTNGYSTLHAEIVDVEIEVVSPSIVPSGNFAELNRTVTCIVLKANDRRTSCPCHDEFRGP